MLYFFAGSCSDMQRGEQRMRSLVQQWRKVAKRIPGVARLYCHLRSRYVDSRRAYIDVKRRIGKETDRQIGNGVEGIFTDIFEKRGWGWFAQSVSGRGSDRDQTKVITKELPRLCREFNVTSILDIPCGDFYWMQCVDLSGIDYTGADIVAELVRRNRERYEREHVCFRKIDLITGELPKRDLILCRDCLVHLSFKDIFASLRNIACCESKYLLTTTFTSRMDNQDIMTGEWRPLNFEIPPFSLPRPIRIIKEGLADRNGMYSDKSLGLWEIEGMRERLSSWCE